MSHHNCKVVDPEKAELEVVQCLACGFHLGVDATFLERVGPVALDCPSCKTPLTIDEIE